MDAEQRTVLRQAHDAFQKADFSAALLACNQILQVAPDNPEALRISGLCLQAMGRHHEAIDRFERAARQDPRVLQPLGVSLQVLGQVTKAAQCFLRAIELSPNVASNYLCLGRLMLERGHIPNAVDCARDAVRLDPGSAPNHLFLAQALVRMGSADEAGSEFRRALARDPNSALLHRLLGFHLLATGETEKARESFERSIALLPSQGHAYLGLSQLKKVTASEREIVDRMLAALEIEGLKPEDRSTLHYGLGKAFDDLAEYGTAMDHYDEANRLAYEQRGPRPTFLPEAASARAAQVGQFFTKERMEGYRSVGDASDLPIFIVGMMRSGTTLVDQILSSHPDVGAAGEVPLWTTDGPNAIDYAADKMSPAFLKGLSNQYLQLLQRISPGTRHVTDKMPANFQMLGLINLALPRAKIVHIKRNPADTCLSIYATPYSVSPSFAHSKENIASAYRHYLRMMELWRQVLPAGTLLEVEYEELVRDRERITREIIRHCGLEWNDACLAPERNARLVSTPSVMQVRQPVFQSSVDRWKRFEPWLGPIKELLEG